MRTVRRLGTALLLALAFTSTVHAQTGDDRLSLNAVVGPSFANVGTTFSALGNVENAEVDNGLELVHGGHRSCRASTGEWHRHTRRTCQLRAQRPRLPQRIQRFEPHRE